MKKGTVLENIVVEAMAAEGKCLARVDGKVLFIEGAAPGDTVDVTLTKIKSSFLEGRAVRITKLSDIRVTPFCSHTDICGGCKWQHINYETQLAFKQQQVIDALERIGGLTLPPVSPIRGSARTQYYRNKLDFSVSAQRWLTPAEMEAKVPFGEPGVGFHVPKSFDKVFDVQRCYLQPDPSNSIRLTLKKIAQQENIPFFDLRKQTGYLRSITIRTANTGDVMVIVQVTADEPAWLAALLDGLLAVHPTITALLYVINAKKNDTFADLPVHTWKGQAFITEQMPKPDGSGMLQFRVGPKSFYQTNSDQAHELYHAAWKLANLQGHERVYDLYTGTGTIANFVAGQAREVIGLEYVADAIEDAKQNALHNNITNTRFFAGDIKDLLDTAFLEQHGKPDVVITDPPRAGMHEDVCKMLLQAAPDSIIYVSCNPATQARDLKILCDAYTITDVQPVDMFPHTMHVENIVRLKRI